MISNIQSPVAVVMAAYNSDATLPMAVRSVLESTLPVDLYVVDDASTVPAHDVLLRHLGAIPSCVTVLRQDVNRGPSPARNAAMRVILERGYRYAAVLDADDIAHPDRFKKQADFLDAFPDVGAVGSWGKAVHEHTLAVIEEETYPPEHPEDIRRTLCLDSCMINTSAMFRITALQEVGLWNENMYTAEDYDLFCRISRRYKLANIPEFLVSFRLCSSGISLRGITAQRRARLVVQRRYLADRYAYWQAWAGLGISTMRVFVPTPWVERCKRIIRRRKIWGLPPH